MKDYKIYDLKRAGNTIIVVLKVVEKEDSNKYLLWDKFKKADSFESLKAALVFISMTISIYVAILFLKISFKGFEQIFIAKLYWAFSIPLCPLPITLLFTCFALILYDKNVKIYGRTAAILSLIVLVLIIQCFSEDSTIIDLLAGMLIQIFI